jgi:hydroxymethylglutaryl-CoA lyase
MVQASKVTIVEVGPRDGFQMEKAFIPTESKIAIINTVARSGVPKIEATSFVSPKAIPQMRDAQAVMEGIERRPGTAYTALVPNLKGAQLAIDAGVDAMRVVICSSEAYNQRNVHMSVAESLKTCEEILQAGRTGSTAVEAVVALAFGCPLEGDIAEEKVVELTRRLAEMGYREISIADSAGLANPAQVQRLMRRLVREFPDVHFSMHIHNTRGLGLANVLAALEEGIDAFDSSLGGLGGCPVVPGARGNIPTEDLVNMLEEMGVETGVDVEGVMVASRVAQEVLERTLPSYVLAAGTRQQLYRNIEEREREKSVTR